MRVTYSVSPRLSKSRHSLPAPTTALWCCPSDRTISLLPLSSGTSRPLVGTRTIPPPWGDGRRRYGWHASRHWTTRASAIWEGTPEPRRAVSISVHLRSHSSTPCGVRRGGLQPLRPPPASVPASQGSTHSAANVPIRLRWYASCSERGDVGAGGRSSFSLPGVLDWSGAARAGGLRTGGGEGLLVSSGRGGTASLGVRPPSPWVGVPLVPGSGRGDGCSGAWGGSSPWVLWAAKAGGCSCGPCVAGGRCTPRGSRTMGGGGDK